jgi:hypothetical protein
MASQPHDEDGTCRPNADRLDRAKRVQSMLKRWAAETVTEPEWDIDDVERLVRLPEGDGG